jgi:hypothetical protein
MSVQTNNKGYRNFAVKMLLFLLTVAVADFIAGTLLKKTYWKQKQGYDYLTTYSIEKTEAQVLVFGSSRAVNIFDPRILKNELGASCFNAGRVAQSVFYHHAVLKAVLKRYTPDVIILSIDAGDFAKESKDYDRLSQLLPYYEKHPEIREVVHLKGPFERLKMISSVYPYNSMLLPIVKGNLQKHNREHSDNGFIPLRKKISGPLHKIDYADYSVLDDKKVNAYRSFIRECQDRGIKLFVICPPYMVDARGEDHSLVMAKKIAREKKIAFLDHSHDPAYTSSQEYFADFKHLNEQGAGMFSKYVANKIRSTEEPPGLD